MQSPTISPQSIFFQINKESDGSKLCVLLTPLSSKWITRRKYRVILCYVENCLYNLKVHTHYIHSLDFSLVLYFGQLLHYSSWNAAWGYQGHVRWGEHVVKFVTVSTTAQVIQCNSILWLLPEEHKKTLDVCLCVCPSVLQDCGITTNIYSTIKLTTALYKHLAQTHMKVIAGVIVKSHCEQQVC